MTLYIKIAKTSTELDALFRARHRVYVEQDGLMPANSNRRILDQFDAFPSTINLIAMRDDEIVGGVRVMLDEGTGTHASEFFDFTPFIDPARRVGSGSMLFMDRSCRGTSRMTSAMMDFHFHVARELGIETMLATINPAVQEPFFRLGYKPLSEILHCPSKGLPFRAAILDGWDSLHPRNRAYLARQSAAKSCETFQRVFYTAAETISTRAQNHLLLSGEIEIVRPNSRSTLLPGETLSSRTFNAAELRALSDVELMPLPKQAHKHLALAASM